MLFSTLLLGVQPGTLKIREVPDDQTALEHDDNYDQNFSPRFQKSVRLNQLVVSKLERTLKSIFRGKSMAQSQDKLTSEQHLFTALLERINTLNEALESLQESVSQLSAHLTSVTASPKSSATLEVLPDLGPVSSETCNLATHFICDNSSCLPLKQHCDGMVDCQDGSDEPADCISVKDVVACEGNEFTCSSGERCLPFTWRCDGDDDCSDFSDEEGCEQVQCQENQIKCATGGMCISSNWKCDGERDCQDGSDEEGCIKVECKENEFKCLSEERCILSTWQCDGDDDCSDSSDEDGCIQAVCKEGYFKCSSGDKCVHSIWRCDGDNDCSDGSDEYGCSYSEPVCDESYFKCLSGEKCIRPSWVCDMDDDCQDGSDEEGCDQQKQCGEGEFQCASTYKCIGQIEVCDGAQNCPDNSDEAECPGQPTSTPTELPFDVLRKSDAESSTELPTDSPDIYVTEVICDEDEFRCLSGGKCIPSRWQCDKDKDCQDGSDEAGCEVTCASDQFRCDAGDCIRSDWRCDGSEDCLDSSDEKHCPSQTTCDEGQYACSSGKCVSALFICDGDKDCDDGSDELLCHRMVCNDNEFSCTADDFCIPDLFRCDGDHDCSNGADELNCPEILCALDEFNCSSDGFCIPQKFHCDGDDDCLDGSDEHHCPQGECSGDDFQCMNKEKCIPKASLCDGVDDCQDKSDEAVCPYLPDIVPVTNSPGDTTHLDKVGSCKMEHGLFPCQNDTICLSSEQVCDGSQDCDDGSDEGSGCDESCPVLGCSHDCFMTPEGHQCICPWNLTLNHLGTTCLGVSSGLLLVGLKNKLEAYSLDGSSSFTVYDSKLSDSGIIGVAYDPVEDMVYWSMKKQGGVYRKNLHAAGLPQIIIDTNDKVVEGLAVDWLGRNLYLADSGHQRITACSLDGVVCSILISDLTSTLRGIQLDFQNRKMFWTQWKSGVVESAGMDGSGKSTLVSDLGWPNAIAVDPSAKMIYWMDALTDKLERSSYSGSNQTLLQDADIDHPFAVDMFDEQLYWTDWKSDQIWKCSRIDCADKTVITETPTQPFGIKVLHPNQFSEVENPCQHHKCSHLCLLSSSSPHGYTCACPMHQVLKDDHHTCVSAPLT